MARILSGVSSSSNPIRPTKADAGPPLFSAVLPSETSARRGSAPSIRQRASRLLCSRREDGSKGASDDGGGAMKDEDFGGGVLGGEKADDGSSSYRIKLTSPGFSSYRAFEALMRSDLVRIAALDEFSSTENSGQLKTDDAQLQKGLQRCAEQLREHATATELASRVAFLELLVVRLGLLFGSALRHYTTTGTCSAPDLLEDDDTWTSATLSSTLSSNRNAAYADTRIGWVPGVYTSFVAALRSSHETKAKVLKTRVAELPEPVAQKPKLTVEHLGVAGLKNGSINIPPTKADHVVQDQESRASRSIEQTIVRVEQGTQSESREKKDASQQTQGVEMRDASTEASIEEDTQTLPAVEHKAFPSVVVETQHRDVQTSISLTAVEDMSAALLAETEGGGRGSSIPFTVVNDEDVFLPSSSSATLDVEGAGVKKPATRRPEKSATSPASTCSVQSGDIRLSEKDEDASRTDIVARSTPAKETEEKSSETGETRGQSPKLEQPLFRRTIGVGTCPVETKEDDRPFAWIDRLRKTRHSSLLPSKKLGPLTKRRSPLDETDASRKTGSGDAPDAAPETSASSLALRNEAQVPAARKPFTTSSTIDRPLQEQVAQLKKTLALEKDFAQGVCAENTALSDQIAKLGSEISALRSSVELGERERDDILAKAKRVTDRPFVHHSWLHEKLRSLESREVGVQAPDSTMQFLPVHVAVQTSFSPKVLPSRTKIGTLPPNAAAKDRTSQAEKDLEYDRTPDDEAVEGTSRTLGNRGEEGGARGGTSTGEPTWTTTAGSLSARLSDNATLSIKAGSSSTTRRSVRASPFSSPSMAARSGISTAMLGFANRAAQ
ncbi:unnamed protein product [Amoebophrya sp. A25]|nr:unnamed protein product [Amoebophrya sp. A25]|eukprot:GSA25T00019582001.1